MDYGKTFIELTDSYTKPQSDAELLTTGASNIFNKYNIYDFAGNVSELTLEVVLKDNTHCVERGGVYIVDGSETPVNDRGNADSGGSTGFRISLYK